VWHAHSVIPETSIATATMMGIALAIAIMWFIFFMRLWNFRSTPSNRRGMYETKRYGRSSMSVVEIPWWFISKKIVGINSIINGINTVKKNIKRIFMVDLSIVFFSCLRSLQYRIR